jgi:hypothetical protein
MPAAPAPRAVKKFVSEPRHQSGGASDDEVICSYSPVCSALRRVELWGLLPRPGEVIRRVSRRPGTSRAYEKRPSLTSEI